MTIHYYNNRKRLTEEKIKYIVKKTFKINKILPKDLLTLHRPTFKMKQKELK